MDHSIDEACVIETYRKPLSDLKAQLDDEAFKSSLTFKDASFLMLVIISKLMLPSCTLNSTEECSEERARLKDLASGLVDEEIIKCYQEMVESTDFGLSSQEEYAALIMHLENLVAKFKDNFDAQKQLPKAVVAPSVLVQPSALSAAASEETGSFAVSAAEAVSSAKGTLPDAGATSSAGATLPHVPTAPSSRSALGNAASCTVFGRSQTRPPSPSPHRHQARKLRGRPSSTPPARAPSQAAAAADAATPSTGSYDMIDESDLRAPSPTPRYRGTLLAGVIRLLGLGAAKEPVKEGEGDRPSCAR